MAQILWPSSAALSCHSQVDEQEIKLPGQKLLPLWDTEAPGGSCTHCLTMPALALPSLKDTKFDIIEYV